MGDPGSVKFDVDLARGVVAVTVRPPMGLASSAVTSEVPIVDVMDLFAQMVLNLNAVSRQAMAQLRAGNIPGAPGGATPQ